ncbi:hypothetical protein [Basilea psittacipulmonis]|uniref:Anti-bacteriophage protein A/HamA C-terminal domain-containing protein n=1 Tax=Basilea psittacipulmonis DSM 24701 TaxID=1072685 RepID=A0A077DH22_9BURK|nr:hypothetical protein [Basilea psittacipulmonis]AIL32722.1 hypothetical protein IX83_04850 [Basilea psittacipulmonis DSM 24701]
MTIAIGKIEYQRGTHPVTALGFSYSEMELNEALANDVKKIVFDVEETQEISNILQNTGFVKESIEKIFNPSLISTENWRIGESIAQCYLSNHRQCFFPWHSHRDERQTKSSLPGADLVGFQIIDNHTYFACVEVKTSSENQHPPRVMTGNSGLESQIKKIVENETSKSVLIKYLAYRCVNVNWEHLFKEAFQNFLENSNNMRLFGFLIRDTKPNSKDIERSIENLAKYTSSNPYIEFLVLYLPDKSIPSLSSKITNYQYGGVA